ncbi:hypothetical protein BKA70DRAFT_1159081 [Coprinopsis sp. MPI-PUGE-AT-0042]|nr:hypothetical protein BKA70DRAFT_1159081 [Coprinopsis sp. MPI-PUGE-AT-0042]
MDACLSCFGRRRQASVTDDDQDPLLPKPNTNHARRDHSAQVPRGTASGYGAADTMEAARVQDTTPHVVFPALEKVVDVVAAFRAGKLPAQDQITRMLQVLLNSQLLRDGLEQGARLAQSRDGTGPTSARGLQVLRDLRAVVQAALEFSIEKNDDNKVQEVFHQLALLNVKGVDVDFNFDPSALPSFKVAEPATAGINAGKESISGVKDQVPSMSEISNDAAILAHALRTILQTTLTSNVFRYILTDVLGILRDLAVQGATDVEAAAAFVQSAAAEVEAELNDADMEQKLDETVEGIQKVNAEHLLDKGKDAVGVAIQAAQGARHQVSDKTEEWKQRRSAALNEAEDDLMARIQQVLVQAQEDPASRRAMRAILFLARKYSEKLAETGDAIVEGAEHVVEEVVSAASQDPGSSGDTSEAKGVAASEGKLPSALPRVSIHTSTNMIDDPVKLAFFELKGMLERMGRGHSLDGVLKALVDVMKDLKELPIELGETLSQEVDQKGKSKISGAQSPPQRSPNIIRAYFARIGQYLDTALDQPGFVTSRKGSNELEVLFMEGLDILDVVGEVADEVGEVLVSGEEVPGMSDEGEDRTIKIRQQFRRHIRVLWMELESFITAMEKDRTTMKLWRAANELASSITDLLSSGPPSFSATNRPRPTAASLVSRIRSSLQWTEWLAWALPRLIHLIPLSAIPIPTLEARSESGGWQAGLYALFVKGEVAKSRARMGRISRADEEALLGGIQSTLIPDEILFKEWTEVRIDMTDEAPEERTVRETQAHGHRLQNARVATTSRIRMHLDGIRARLDGLGYYFQYGQPNGWIGYEDEGILNVDIGMGYPHAGLGCDVEIEVTTGKEQSYDETSGHRAALRNLLVPTSLAGEGIEGEGELATATEIYVDEAGLRTPQQGMDEALLMPGKPATDTPNTGPTDLDVQGVLGTPIDRERDQETPPNLNGVPHPEVQGEDDLEPSFKVVDVRVQMEGAHVELQKSRHWILNKLLVQPLAGPAIHRLVQVVLADKIRDGLGTFALELAKMSKDAHAHAEKRRDRIRQQRLQERARRIDILIRQGKRGINPDLIAPLEEEDDSVWDMIGDWASAIIESGSRVISQRVEGAEEEDNFRVDTGVEATLQGVIIHSSTAVTDDAGEEANDPPPMVFTKREKPAEGVQGQSNGGAERTNVSDITVAIGGGAQLFPDKQVPYREHNDAAPSEDTVLDRAVGMVQGVTDVAKGTAKEVTTVADQVQVRYEEDLRREQVSGWRSKAFDF